MFSFESFRSYFSGPTTVEDQFSSYCHEIEEVLDDKINHSDDALRTEAFRTTVEETSSKAAQVFERLRESFK